MALNTLYNEATVSTERYFARKVVDHIFTSNPLMLRLKSNARTVGGGESFELVGIYAKGDGEWFGEWDTYTATHKEQIGAGRLDWKLYTVPVVLSHLQLLKNGESRERRFNLAMQKNIIASKTAADDVATAMFVANGSESANAIDSLNVAISDSTETTTTYANITRTGAGDTLVWDAQLDTTTTTLSLSALQSLYGDCQEGSERPDLSVTTQDNFDRYWNLLTPIQRLGSDEMGRAGFTSLLFNGHPVVVDSHCPAGYWYFLNMQHIELVAHRLANFTFERAVMPNNQWVHIGRYYFVGNLLVHAPRYQGKFTAIAA
jgi:hypothetical protein